MAGTLAHPPQSEPCFLLLHSPKVLEAIEPESHVCPLYPSALCLTESKWFQSAWLKAWLTEATSCAGGGSGGHVSGEKQDQDQERETLGSLLGQCGAGSTWGLWADRDIQ